MATWSVSALSAMLLTFATLPDVFGHRRHMNEKTMDVQHVVDELANYIVQENKSFVEDNDSLADHDELWCPASYCKRCKFRFPPWERDHKISHTCCDIGDAGGPCMLLKCEENYDTQRAMYAILYRTTGGAPEIAAKEEQVESQFFATFQNGSDRWGNDHTPWTIYRNPFGAYYRRCITPSGIRHKKQCKDMDLPNYDPTEGYCYRDMHATFETGMERMIGKFAEVFPNSSAQSWLLWLQEEKGAKTSEMVLTHDNSPQPYDVNHRYAEIKKGFHVTYFVVNVDDTPLAQDDFNFKSKNKSDKVVWIKCDKASDGEEFYHAEGVKASGVCEDDAGLNSTNTTGAEDTENVAGLNSTDTTAADTAESQTGVNSTNTTAADNAESQTGVNSRDTHKLVRPPLATEESSRARSFARTHARNANASAIEIDFPVRGLD